MESLIDLILGILASLGHGKAKSDAELDKVGKLRVLLLLVASLASLFLVLKIGMLLLSSQGQKNVFIFAITGVWCIALFVIMHNIDKHHTPPK